MLDFTGKTLDQIALTITPDVVVMRVSYLLKCQQNLIKSLEKSLEIRPQKNKRHLRVIVMRNRCSGCEEGQPDISPGCHRSYSVRLEVEVIDVVFGEDGGRAKQDFAAIDDRQRAQAPGFNLGIARH